MNRFLWVLVGIVLLVGIARLIVVYSSGHSDDQKILINKSK